MASTAAVLNILVNAQTGTAQAQLTALDAKLKQTAATATGTSGAMGKWGKGMVGAAGAVAAVGAVSAVVAKQLYDLGVEFDDAYDKIRVGTGATGKELDRLKKSFKEVAKDVPNDFGEVGQAIADVNTRMGLTGKPLERMTENFLHLSNATGTDLRSNIKSVARAFTDWEVPVKRQAAAMDGLFRLQQESGATVSELADNIQKFGSPLRTLGLDMDYAAAMFATFEKAGVNMQTMVPGLKLFIGNLVQPTEELAAQMKQLGINAADPEKALKRTFQLLGKDSPLGDPQKKILAIGLFGKRAFSDMAEAVRQGRFDVDRFMEVFNDKKGDNIRKAADESYDFAENAKILGNNLKIFLEPAAQKVFIAADDAVRALGRLVKVLGGDKNATQKAPQWIRDTADVLRALWAVTKLVWEAQKILARHLVGKVKPAVKATADVVGWLSDAWKDARDWTVKAGNGIARFVSGLWGKMKSGFNAVKNGMAGVFSSAWDRVESIFTGGANAILSVVRGIIDVINLIPGVDIEKPGNVGGGRGDSKWNLFQRGGELQGGKPSGDSIPALLERGEYVLNRKAVQRVGVDRLNELNFKAASRFQTGGPVGMIGGGAVNAVKNVVGKVADTAMNGPGFFLDKLPKPDIPQPFTGVGPYLIEQVTEWIKSKVPKILGGGSGGSWSGGSGTYPGVSGDTDFTPALGMALSKMSKAAGQSIYVQSGWRSYAEQAALYEAYLNGTGNLAAPPGSSNHESGRAADITPGSEVFGSMASRFGLGFTVPGESWHIELLRRGGLVGLARMAAGGLAGRRGGIPGSRDVWSNDQLASLAHAAGMASPGYMAQIANGESSGRPWAIGNDPGGTTGLGLWQITTSYNDDLIAKYGGRDAMLNPLKNAQAAKEILDRQGIGAWYAPPRGPRGEVIGWLAQSLRRMMNGEGGMNADEPTAREKAEAAAKARREKREGLIARLRGAVGSAESKTGRKSALWKLISAYSKYGKLDEDQQSHILDKVRKAASKVNPLDGVPILQNLAQWASDKVSISGHKDTNEAFSSRVGEARETSAAAAKRQRDIARQKARVRRRNARIRENKLLQKISAGGTTHPWTDSLTANGTLIQAIMEEIDLLERRVGSDGSPGGSEETQEEITEQVMVWQRLKDAQIARMFKLSYAKEHMERFRKEATAMFDKAQRLGSPGVINKWSDEETKWGSSAKWLSTQRNKVADLLKKAKPKAKPKLREQLAGIIKSLGEARGKHKTARRERKEAQRWGKLIEPYRSRVGNASEVITGLNEDHLDLVGYTGKGGTFGDTKARLAELGVQVGWTPEPPEPGDTPDTPDTGVNTELLDLLRQQLAASQRSLAISQAQMPIFQQFMPRYHSGGIVGGAGEVPIMAQAGEGVFTRDQMKAMGGAQNITVIVEDGAVDSDRIRVEVDGVLAQHISSARRSTGGRKFVTNG